MSNNEILFQGLKFSGVAPTIKEDRIIACYRDSAFPVPQKAIIPSTQYPIAGQFELFVTANTSSLQIRENGEFTAVSEEAAKILAVIDKQRHDVGKCYFNADRVTSALQSKGYNAQTYVGWFFLADTMPAHHAWTVLRLDDKVSVIDLADNFYHLYEGYDKMVGLTLDEQRMEVAKQTRKMEKMPNSKRCVPVGVPCPIAYYIGSPQGGMEGLKLFEELMNKQPYHPAHKKLKGGLTKTQAMYFADAKKKKR